MSPRGTATAASTSRVAIPARQPRVKSTVLIAEDNADSREMMQLLFEMKGYEVLAAGDGPHAVQMAIKNTPDMIFLDLQLPKLDGIGVTRELRLRPELKDARIIIITGHDPMKYRRAALEAGCDDYVLKPIDFDNFSDWLESLSKRSPRPRIKSL